MCYNLSHTANPDDSLALYVSDNPAGPVRLVKRLKPISSPPPVGGVDLQIGASLLQEPANYYFWLDHGPGQFPMVRAPAGLLANSDNPIPFDYWYYLARDTLDSPEIEEIFDPPLNNGNELLVSWTLSADDAVIDYYNVYRESVELGTGPVWVASVPRGTSSFRDVGVHPGILYRYTVSVAHHGAGGGQTANWNVGIWNDFGGSAMATPVDDFPIIAASVRRPGTGLLDEMPASSAVGCPQGDSDEIVVTVQLGAFDEMSCVQASALTLGQPESSGSAFYPDDVTIYADSATAFVPADPAVSNAHCVTTFTVGSFGGCGIDSALVSLYGVPIGYARLNVKSPDILIGAGTRAWVGLGDFGEFGSHYQSSVCNCVYSNDYSACADFVLPDTAVTSGDLGFFGAHYQHGDPTGGGNPAPAQLTASSGSVRLEFVEEQPLLGPHRLAVRIALENIEPLKAMVIALANGNSALSFLEWTPSSSYPGRTMAVTTERDGQKQLFVGVLGSKNAPSDDGLLGTAEFLINSDEPFSLSDGDFALVTADVMELGGRILQVSPDSRRVTHDAPSYRNELAQNYPNPFNPQTTIAFSLAVPAETQLRVFDVRGASVRTLVRGRRSAGLHHVEWDGRTDAGQPVASGVYFYRLTTGSFAETKKMIILR